MSRWYVAAVQPSAESLAAQNLKNQAFTVYAPMVERTKVVRGEKRAFKAPIFPNYIFIEFDIHRTRWRSINGTRGVVRLLPVGSEIPQAVPDGFVEELRRRVESGEFNEETLDDWIARLVKGDEIGIASGALADRVGKFLGRSRGRVILLLSLVGRDLVVHVPAHQVAPIKASA